GPLTLLLIDLLADKVHAVSALGAQAIVTRAVGPQKALIVAVEDRKGPLVLDLEAGSRAAAHPVGTGELALIARLLEDAPSHLEGDVPRLRRRARPAVTASDLVRTRRPFSRCVLSHQASLELLLRVLPLEGKVQSPLKDVCKVLLWGFDAEDLRHPQELLLAVLAEKRKL